MSEKSCKHCVHGGKAQYEMPCRVCPGPHVEGSQYTTIPEGNLPVTATREVTGSALQVQVGGDHYKSMKIQPLEYIMANNIPFPEGNIIKYVSRWRKKNGMQDLKKAQHILSVIIEAAEAGDYK